MTPKDIAAEIIAEGMLRKGKDLVSNVYQVSREVNNYLIEFMEREREKEREIRPLTWKEYADGLQMIREHNERIMKERERTEENE